MELQKLVESNRIIPGVKDQQGLKKALRSDSDIIFVLFGDIISIEDITDQIRAAGKHAFVNVDLLEGGSGRDTVIRFLHRYTNADGVLSSKAAVLKAAKKLGFYTIHRFFIIDSFSFQNLEKQTAISEPDILEILPGWPKLITWTREKTDIPIISGGMVCTHEDARASLDAGAVSISTTNDCMWPRRDVRRVVKKTQNGS